LKGGETAIQSGAKFRLNVYSLEVLTISGDNEATVAGQGAGV